MVRVVAVSSARRRGGSIQTAHPAAATGSGVQPAVHSNGMPWDDEARWRSSGTRPSGGVGRCRTRLGLQRESRARSLAAFAIRRPAADRSRRPRAVGRRRGEQDVNPVRRCGPVCIPFCTAVLAGRLIVATRRERRPEGRDGPSTGARPVLSSRALQSSRSRRRKEAPAAAGSVPPGR